MGKDSMNDTAHRIDEELSKLSITEHRAITRMLTALFRFRAARDKAHSEMLGRTGARINGVMRWGRAVSIQRNMRRTGAST